MFLSSKRWHVFFHGFYTDVFFTLMETITMKKADCSGIIKSFCFIADYIFTLRWFILRICLYMTTEFAGYGWIVNEKKYHENT